MRRCCSFLVVIVVVAVVASTLGSHCDVFVVFSYNKTEEDFPSLREYNDYLEEVEDIMFTLVNGSKAEIEETWRKVNAYEASNTALIHRNRARQMDTTQLIQQEINAQREDQEKLQSYSAIEDLRLHQHKRKLRKEAIEVALGEREAVSATVSDLAVLSEAGQAPAGPQADASRTMLHIDAPLPRRKLQTASASRFSNMDPAKVASARRKAGAAPSQSDFHRKTLLEAASSLFEDGPARLVFLSANTRNLQS